MGLYNRSDPMRLVALENEDKLKQSLIDQLTEENNERTMLIDQLRHDCKALALEYERGRKKQNELSKECESEERMDPETVKVVMLEIEQLRESNAALLAVMREERGAGGDHSRNGKRRLCRGDALVFQRKALEDSYQNLQRQMSPVRMTCGTEYAFKHSICLVKGDGGVSSEGDLENNQSGSGGHDLCVERVTQVTQVDSCSPQNHSLVTKRLIDDSKVGGVDSCPPQRHQVANEQLMTQVKETTNLEVKIGSKHELDLGTKKSVPLAEERPAYNISDCILRKKCFDDEEIVDEVDEDTEELILETYSKKVTFDEDVQEEETVEEELEDDHEEVEERDTVTALQEEEEEEFLSTDDEDLAEEKKEEEVRIVGKLHSIGLTSSFDSRDIGQFRKKTFDDEEVIHEVDSEVEMLISKTYANFTPLESPTVPSDTTEDDLHESAVSDTEVDLHVTISRPGTCNVGTQTEGVYPTGPITNTLMAPVPVLPIQSSSNFMEMNSGRNGHASPSQIEGPNINWFSGCPRPPPVGYQQSAIVLGPLYRGSTPNASYYRNADLTTSAVSVIGFTQAGLPVRIATNLNLGVASTVTQTGPTSYIVYSNGVSSAVYL